MPVGHIEGKQASNFFFYICATSSSKNSNMLKAVLSRLRVLGEFDDLLQRKFSRLGEHVARSPRHFFFGTLLVTIMCLTGVKHFEFEARD